MTVDPLNTATWLNVRSSYRYSFVTAWLGSTPAPVDPETTDQRSTVYACEVNSNTAFESINQGYYVYQNSAKGWPAADTQTAELLEGLSSATAPIRMDKAIQLQLQINGLESFRKQLLHKRQRRKQLIRAYQAQWAAEEQSQTEFASLLFDVPIGRHVDPSGST
jgi:hypothetical protein